MNIYHIYRISENSSKRGWKQIFLKLKDKNDLVLTILGNYGIMSIL